MLNLASLQRELSREPFDWVFVDALFAPSDAAALTDTYPRDHFKQVAGRSSEKGYEYLSRSLVHMGADAVSYPDELSPAWRTLAEDLLSTSYRDALGNLLGQDLNSLVMEVNVIRYGPGAYLGPHLDLAQKVVTHVLYFNETWDRRDGGCLRVLRSKQEDDVHTEVLPLVGNSVALVRSDHSWHMVSRVAEGCSKSRLSVNVIFHLPGSISTMWPPGENAPLIRYEGP